MHHCWVRLSVVRDGRVREMYMCFLLVVCVCVCVCGCESLCIFILVYEHLIGSVFVGVCMCEFYPLPYFIFARRLCMYVSFSFLSASQPALPLIGEACWMTQHHTLRDSLSAG